MCSLPQYLLHKYRFAARLLGCVLAVGAIPALAAEREQMIIVSFDGAHDNALWTRSLALAEKTKAKFTYFLGCTYLMSGAEAPAYQGPGHRRGKSNVGFATDHDDVAERLSHIWTGFNSGHEMGSHGCGHFDGGKWSAAQWEAEFDQFDTALADSWKTIGRPEDEPDGWRNFAQTAIKGFRAPYLSTGPGLFTALAKHGFDYDASTVSQGPVLPDIGQEPVQFALPMIPEGPRERRIIAMDYNLFVRHSDAEEKPGKKDQFADRTLSAFRTAFKAQYDGDRLPLQMGFHFVEMNGGAYWDALDTFLNETCVLPNVACVTYGEALKRLRLETDEAS
mgnify:CR=1 FL=1